MRKSVLDRVLEFFPFAYLVCFIIGLILFFAGKSISMNFLGFFRNLEYACEMHFDDDWLIVTLSEGVPIWLLMLSCYPFSGVRLRKVHLNIILVILFVFFFADAVGSVVLVLRKPAIYRLDIEWWEIALDMIMLLAILLRLKRLKDKNGTQGAVKKTGDGARS